MEAKDERLMAQKGTAGPAWRKRQATDQAFQALEQWWEELVEETDDEPAPKQPRTGEGPRG